ncbi:MAG TPA: iron-containing alcohol dehydrogenase [Acidiphilium sp.]|jgi:alcohol dehydrogenase class IV|uniref:iron-containing alcohol dehydrogenase n=1 Tax=unclassified Acidiphilium TaxID=2617493 RepID=UPI000BD2810F|nr:MULTISPECIES: iron-containing alcohol dehydrogenase [unclassified Acidiphilium]OYV55611.1 MAG: alcohol dehydrogenase [Acidiphilium sp. 20-67-58]HQT60199.1 iron-containing alcohol dehydrogenase [Acidiphilium sp.]HQU10815.1 iron-containing alcohol dehydrogenase [Acidiphilium sp.]
MDIGFFAPRHMDIGGGSAARIAALLGRLGLSRPLIVTDPVMVKLGLVRRITDPLEAAGIVCTIFSDTVPEPVDTVVEAGVAAARGGEFDCLIGFGGGSPIDTAKAINILLAAAPGARMRDFKVPVAADAAALPLIAVPTTAGTGSEATRFTVITDTETDEKMLIAGLGALPLAAVVDYELTMSVPPRTTADTGIDAFTHALEAYVSRRANPVSDAYARSAMRLIGANLRKVWQTPQDRDAREAMMLGATLAGLAFSNASVALVHGMSRPIGAHFHVPHGMSNAMLLPAVTRFSLNASLPRYAEASRLAGFARADDADQLAGARLIEALEAINAELEVPTPEGFGVSRADWDALLPKMAEQALASGSPGNNPAVPDAAEIVRIYDEIF